MAITYYDAVMAGLVLAGMAWGAIRGFTWQIASIASLAVAYAFSHQVSAQIAPYIAGDPVIKRAGSMLAAYVLVSGGVFFLAWTVRGTLKKLKFEAYDRHLGMVMGGLEGALLGVVGTLFVVSLAPGSRGPIFASPSGKLVARVMDAAGPVLPKEFRRVLEAHWDDSPTKLADLPAAVADAAIKDATTDSPSEGSSLLDLARGARSRIGRAVGDAVKSEVERLGDNDDERSYKRR